MNSGVSAARPRSVLMLVENLPSPFDRRVWQEACALRDAGYVVSIICPTGKGCEKKFEAIDDIHIWRYDLPLEAAGAAGYAVEYAAALLQTFYLCWKVLFTRGFDVIHACNPPDLFFLIGGFFKLLGKKFVFDHHDLCPELYDSRFPHGSTLPRRGLIALERATFHTADHVVATNVSYAEVAMRRGEKDAAEVTVVRTGPDQDRLHRRPPVPALRRGRNHLVAYLGVMGPQDGVDLAVRAAAHVVHNLGRKDVAFTFMGSGDSYHQLVSLRDELGLQDYIELPGRVPDDTVLDVLSTADVGLSPDPKNPLNDVSTMNKTMEYMAFGLPVVAFDLKETRVSAGAAASYIQNGDVAAYAKAIVELLDDCDKREAMGRIGRLRIEEELGWSYQRDAYVGVYDALVGRHRVRG